MSSTEPPCQSDRKDKQQELAENQEKIQQTIREKEEEVKVLQQKIDELRRRSSELELLSQTDDHTNTAEATDSAVLDTMNEPQEGLGKESTETSQINNESTASGKDKLDGPSKKLHEHPDEFTIAVLGRNPEFNNIVKNAILSNGNGSDKTLNDSSVDENSSFRIISIHDLFNEECPDQQKNDFMTDCSLGINLFILAVDSQNAQIDDVVSEITNLQDIAKKFGETVTEHLVVVFENYKSYKSLGSQLKETFHIDLGTLSEHLANDCKEWFSSRPVFKYDYRNYSKEIVKCRKNDSKRKRNEDDHERAGSANLETCTYDAPAETPPEQTIGERESSMLLPEINIVLLGQTGTGKSASGNTILTAVDPEMDPSQLFVSKPSSSPVTSKCEFKEMNVFGRQVRVVDTPDFFDEDVDSQVHLDECKKYCQSGNCVVLLVIQMGRFTDGEKGILERLEEKLGWRIRESTIVLLTHGENAKGNEQSFIVERTYLESMVRACGNRVHIFTNTSKNRKQVMELFKKIPDHETIFPQFTEKP